MARKRNEEYIGEDDDGEFEEEPVETFEDPPDFVDEVTDEGESHEFKKCGKHFGDEIQASDDAAGLQALSCQVLNPVMHLLTPKHSRARLEN